MTWAKLLANGSGRLRLRLMIEGWPEVFVSDPSITFATNADDRTVLSGLSYEGVQFGDRCLPWEGSIQAQGITFTVTPTYGKRTSSTTGTDPILASLTTWPDPIGYLDSSWAYDNTTFPTVTGAALVDGTVYHIGTEAVRYKSDSADERGVWDTIAQTHNTSRLDETSTVYVYERPPTMEGRRAYLYVYGQGDDVAGDGTCVWRGVVSRPPRQHSDGVSWRIECLPVTHWLKQTVGGGYGDIKPIGMYHNWKSGFFLRLEYGTANNAITGSADIVVYGLDTEETFISDVNTQLATALTSTGANANFDYIRIGVDSAGWYIEAKKNDADSVYLSVAGGSHVVGYVSVFHGKSQWVANSFVVANGNNLSTAVTYSTRFDFQEEWFGSLFRGKIDRNAYDGLSAQPVGSAAGVLNSPGLLNANLFVDQSESLNWPANRVYVDHDLSSVAAVRVEGLNYNFGPGADIFDVTDSGTTTLVTPAGSQDFYWVEIGSEALLSSVHNGMGGYAGTVTKDTEIKVVRSYTQSGSICDFRDALVTKSVEANDGDTPWITDRDLAAWSLTQSIAPEVLARQFAFLKPIAVEAIVGPDLKLAAHFMRIESDGRIGISPISLPSEGRASASIDHSSVLTPPTGQWPGIEPQRDGFFSSLTLQQKYDAVEDKWVDQPVTVQLADVIATHKNRGRGKLTIKTYSAPMIEPSGEALQSAARALLRLAAVDYVAVTVQVPFTMFSVLCGDYVTLTHRLIPEGDGTRGVTDRTCMVIERKWNLDPARNSQGTLVLLMPVRPIGGYAHSGLITSQTGSGTAWTVTLDVANTYNTLVSPQLDGDVASTFRVNDVVRVEQLDSDTPTAVTGTVTAVSGDDVSITFDATWTPGSDAWVMTANAITDATATQLKYTFVVGAVDDGARRFS